MMELWSAFTIITTGSLVAASCALLGCFLILRRQAMLGDAISHAILPGIVIAFWLSESLGPLYMLAGAAFIGILTTYFIQLLSGGGVHHDAAMGVTFTSLFALGVVGVTTVGYGVHLDLECVLYGEIAYAPFDSLLLGGINWGPRSIWINGGLFLMNASLIALFYKPYKLCSFDPAMAAALGIPITFFHYLLMTQVSLTVVGAFENVGVILVVAMIVAPAAAAYLLTDHLGMMLLCSVLNGVASAVLGYFTAAWLDCSIAGAMGMAAGFIFALAFLFSPAHGLLTRWLALFQLRRQVTQEDVLLWAGRQMETGTRAQFSRADLLLSDTAPPRRAVSALRRLQDQGMVESDPQGYALTHHGRDAFNALIKRHRIYESFLGELGYPEDHLHAPTDRVEHHIPHELTEQMDQEIQRPIHDPQGKSIPREDQ